MPLMPGASSPWRRLLVVAVLLVSTSPLGARRQSPGASYSWVGTGSVSWTFAPAVAFSASDYAGALHDERTIQLRVKETRQRSVTDANGTLIGQIVAFEDDGTTWTGSVVDTESHLGSIKFDGQGSGSGGAQVFGAMYRSAVTPNPLADVLPDGAYTMTVILSPPIKYLFTLTENGKLLERSNEESAAQLVIGDGRMAMWLALSGKQPTEASLRAAIARPIPGQPVTEGRGRVLEGDRMHGQWDHLPWMQQGTTGSGTWSLNRVVTVHPTLTETPNDWRPEWMGETAFTAAIDPSLGQKGRFRFTLYEVSREPGTCMNYGGGTGPDLDFGATQPAAMTAPTATADGWTIETTADSASATVNVRALDYGAWGKLKAEVFVGGGWQLATTQSGQSYATIPLDKNNDHIADQWMVTNEIVGQRPEDDADAIPDGKNTGDGMSNYEEYRGFMVHGQWTDTDPRYKDLFINNEATMDGCGAFPSTGVFCELINSEEYDANRVVNFNAHNATAGPQKGILIISEDLQTTVAPGTLGATYPDSLPPNDIDHIGLDLPFIAKFNERGVTDAGAITPITTARMSVIAHELGHAVGIDHHGSNGATTACGSSGVEVGDVAIWGGAYSGDRACFMSYPRPSRYQRPDGSCYDWPWPHSWGLSICASRAGTGINAGPTRIEDGHPLPASGDATKGDCAHQLRIKK